MNKELKYSFFVSSFILGPGLDANFQKKNTDIT